MGLIIEYIKDKNKKGIPSVSTKELYVELEKIVREKDLTNRYNMETFTNTIRGELNTHEIDSPHKSNLKLFKRAERSFYSLTENGKKYNGR